MTRLAAVLAGALEHIDRVGMHLDNHEAADQLVAAIPEPERSALEAGLLLAEVTTKLGVIDLWLGMDFATLTYWATANVDDGNVEGSGPTLHAALAALLDRLVAA